MDKTEYTDDMREFDKDMEELRQKKKEFWDSVDVKKESKLPRKDRLRYMKMYFEIMDRVEARKQVSELKNEN